MKDWTQSDPTRPDPMKKWTRSDPIGPEKIQYFKVHAALLASVILRTLAVQLKFVIFWLARGVLT